MLILSKAILEANENRNKFLQYASGIQSGVSEQCDLYYRQYLPQNAKFWPNPTSAEWTSLRAGSGILLFLKKKKFRYAKWNFKSWILDLLIYRARLILKLNIYDTMAMNIPFFKK